MDQGLKNHPLIDWENELREAYGIELSGLQPLHGGNYARVFGFKREEDNLVLRLTPPNSGANLLNINAIMSWMAYLNKHGCPVVEPICSAEGEWVTVLDRANTQVYATVVRRAEGNLAETLHFEDWTASIIERLGQVVGRMHTLAEAYKPTFPELKPLSWEEVGNLFQSNTPPDSPSDVFLQYVEALEAVRAVPHNQSGYGLVHLDLHCANFFIDLPTCKVTLFDFDDCAYGWYIMDLATLLFDLPVVYPQADPKWLNHFYLPHFLKGYRSERQIADHWLDQLPKFLKLLELSQFLTLLPVYDPVKPEGWVGKFMAGRLERIRQNRPYLDFLDTNHP